MEELLKELIEQNNQLFKEIKEVKQQNATLAEQNRELQQQISELKANQSKAIKEALENTIKEELSSLIEFQIEKITKNLEESKVREEATIENQHEIAEFLKLLQKELVNYIKESKENDKELIDKGDKILEVLDDIGNTVLAVQDGILDSNSRWGEAMLERFDTLGIGIAGLAKRVDKSAEWVKENNDLTYKAVKNIENLIERKSVF